MEDSREMKSGVAYIDVSVIWRNFMYVVIVQKEKSKKKLYLNLRSRSYLLDHELERCLAAQM